MHGGFESLKPRVAERLGTGSGSHVLAAALLCLSAIGKALPLRARHLWRPHSRQTKLRCAHIEPPNVADPAAQMEFVARVDFEPQRLLNKSEYRIFLLLEAVTRGLNAGLRVMAQTCMGEIVRPKKGSASESDCNLAYRSINSKRIDFVIINRFGIPILAIEHQGDGHYHSRSFMRDAVKREALRKANIVLIEVPSDYDADDLRTRLGALLKASIKS
jgi:hypothetical protein